MAHEIDFSKGRPAIAYKGDKPWHGFGRLMSEDENLEEWKVAAGLDWTVEPRQVLYKPDPTSNPFIVKPYEPRRVLVCELTESRAWWQVTSGFAAMIAHDTV